MTLSEGEKLILAMLCEIKDHLRVQDGIETQFIRSVLFGGHYWAIDEKYPGMLRGEPDNPETVREVVEIMDMWVALERAYDGFPDADRASFDASDIGAGGARFPGFDSGTKHYEIARFLVDHLGRCPEFKNRDLYSRVPSLDRYRRMLRAFKPVLEAASYHGLGPDGVKATLEAGADPSAARPHP